MSSVSTMTMSPADILKYQNECIRTGDYEPLGRMQKIAIGPNAKYVPPANDPIISKVGRFIELRGRVLPLAQTRDRSLLLVPALMLGPDGRPGLPDIPDPKWLPPPPTQEEIEGIEVKDSVTGKVHREFPKDSPRSNVRMLPQRLEDRAEGLLAGTNFMVFSPVLSITFQPEIEKRLVGSAWLISAMNSDGTLKIGPDHTHLTLLVDAKTGETHFFGGAYEIIGSLPK